MSWNIQVGVGVVDGKSEQSSGTCKREVYQVFREDAFVEQSTAQHRNLTNSRWVNSSQRVNMETAAGARRHAPALLVGKNKPMGAFQIQRPCMPIEANQANKSRLAARMR